MADDVMTIRQMCEAFDVTPRALRFYEQKELLAPIRQGTRRLYTRRERARLQLILRGKRFGYSLEDIRQLLDLYEVDPTRRLQIEKSVEAARARIDQMRAERDEMDRVIDELESHIAWGEGQLNADAA